ncbi:MAG TPA: malonate decarboxylase holo-ACP synthase [Candidatus Dormibacteraeota bacterium]|nr:malonate decarboxylase holo-ACP synthase [Candidatus Dormibacteraeota bacterium]
MHKLRAHDLVRLAPRAVARIARSAPYWVERSLDAAPWAVVRRARVPGAVAIGVRGEHRDERFATELQIDDIACVLTPEGLLERPATRALDAFVALAAVARAGKEHGLRLGPTGSVGFELATGVACVSPRSDLDVVVRAHPSDPALRRFAEALRELPARVDVEIAFGEGCGVALEEALRAGPMLVKTPDGPRMRS